MILIGLDCLSILFIACVHFPHTWLNWSLKFHSGLRTIPHLIHTRLLFNKCLFHLCDCTCSNVMCILNFLSIKPKKDFWVFYMFLNVFFYTFVFWFFVQIAFFMFFIKNSKGIFVRSSQLSSSRKNRLRKNMKIQNSNRNFRNCFAAVKSSSEMFCTLKAFFVSNFVRSQPAKTRVFSFKGQMWTVFQTHLFSLTLPLSNVKQPKTWFH